MGLLTGKVALVTGAARGIGRAVALEMAKEGADVAFTDLAVDDNALKTEKDIQALGVKGKAYASNAANFEEAHKVVDEVAADFGSLYGNNSGVSISIVKSGVLKRFLSH